MFFSFMDCRYKKEGLKAKKMQKIAKIWKGQDQDTLSAQHMPNANTGTLAKQEEVR